MATEKLPNPREFADTRLAELRDAGKIPASGDGSPLAGAVPTFSKGTAALDEDTGQPIIPKSQQQIPSFQEQHVDLPAPTDTQGGAPSPQAQEPAPPAPAGPPPQQQQQAAAATEAVAQQMADEWDEFEFEDPDLGAKITMRAPKQYAEVAKRGYGRRAAHDRAISYAKNADPILRQMIEDGRINQVLPLIRAAIEDNEYGQFVAEAYQRRQRGESLLQQAIREQQAPPVANPPPQVEEFADPFLAEQIRPVIQQYEQKYETLQQRLDRMDQERQAAERAAREAQQRQVQIAQELRGAHEDLASMYHGRFSTERGPNDPLWQTANQIAREGQYCERYGYRAGMIFAGQAAVAMEQERLAATQSPTAQVLQQAEARLLTAAQSEAARSAQTVSGGGPGASAPAPIPPKPTPKNPDGSLKPKDEYLAAVAAWHQQYGRLKQG